jgi:hypothetical protein
MLGEECLRLRFNSKHGQTNVESMCCTNDGRLRARIRPVGTCAQRSKIFHSCERARLCKAEPIASHLCCNRMIEQMHGMEKHFLDLEDAVDKNWLFALQRAKQAISYFRSLPAPSPACEPAMNLPLGSSSDDRNISRSVDPNESRTGGTFQLSKHHPTFKS